MSPMAVDPPSLTSSSSSLVIVTGQSSDKPSSKASTPAPSTGPLPQGGPVIAARVGASANLLPTTSSPASVPSTSSSSSEDVDMAGIDSPPSDDASSKVNLFPLFL